MSEYIAEHCRQYVGDHAGDFDGLSEGEAIDALEAGMRASCRSEDWNEDDYMVHIKAIAGDGLRQYRRSK